MQKKRFMAASAVVVSCATCASVAGTALAAEDTTETRPGAQQRRELRQEQYGERDAMRDANQAERRAMQEKYKDATPEQRGEMRQERKDMMDQNREERKDMRQEQLTERRELRGSLTERRAEQFAAKYAKIKEKMANIVKRLTDAGVDTTALSAALATLDTKAATVTDAAAAYKVALSGTDKDAIQAALANLRSARDAFHTYYQETVRPAIVAAVTAAKAKVAA